MDRNCDFIKPGNSSAYRSSNEVFSLNDTTGEDPLDLDGGDSPTKCMSTLSIDEDAANKTNTKPQDNTTQVSFPLKQTSLHKFFTMNDTDPVLSDTPSVSTAGQLDGTVTVNNS